MSDGYNVKSMTSDLGYLLTLTNMFSADADGYWYLPSREERYTHKLDKNDDPREIVIVQDPMPRGNYLTFNPFSEGMGKQTPANQLFYRSLRVAMNVTVQQVVLYCAAEVLETKIAAAEQPDAALTFSEAVIRVSSIPLQKKQTIYDVIDEETIKELKLIFDRLDSNLIQVPYLTASMTAKVTCAAFDDAEFDGKYGKDIRKKTLQVFRALILGILGITKPEELSKFSEKYQAETKSAPRLHSTMMVYFKLYSSFGDLIETAYGSDSYNVDLGRLFTVISENFPKAYPIGKHINMPSTSAVKAVDVKTTDTSGMRFATPNPNQGRFHNPSTTSVGVGTSGQGGQGARFKPHFVESTPRDPFAFGASSAPQNQGTMGGGIGTMSPGTMNPTPLGGGGFGGNFSTGGSGFIGGGGGTMMGHNSMGYNQGIMGNNPGAGFGGNFAGGANTFNFNAPSNFGMPGTQRQF